MVGFWGPAEWKKTEPTGKAVLNNTLEENFDVLRVWERREW